MFLYKTSLADYLAIDIQQKISQNIETSKKNYQMKIFKIYKRIFICKNYINRLNNLNICSIYIQQQVLYQIYLSNFISIYYFQIRQQYYIQMHAKLDKLLKIQLQRQNQQKLQLSFNASNTSHYGSNFNNLYSNKNSRDISRYESEKKKHEAKSRQASLYQAYKQDLPFSQLRNRFQDALKRNNRNEKPELLSNSSKQRYKLTYFGKTQRNQNKLYNNQNCNPIENKKEIHKSKQCQKLQFHSNLNDIQSYSRNKQPIQIKMKNKQPVLQLFNKKNSFRLFSRPSINRNDIRNQVSICNNIAAHLKQTMNYTQLQISKYKEQECSTSNKQKRKSIQTIGHSKFITNLNEISYFQNDPSSFIQKQAIQQKQVKIIRKPRNSHNIQLSQRRNTQNQQNQISNKQNANTLLENSVPIITNSQIQSVSKRKENPYKNSIKLLKTLKQNQYNQLTLILKKQHNKQKKLTANSHFSLNNSLIQGNKLKRATKSSARPSDRIQLKNKIRQGQLIEKSSQIQQQKIESQKFIKKRKTERSQYAHRPRQSKNTGLVGPNFRYYIQEVQAQLQKETKSNKNSTYINQECVMQQTKNMFLNHLLLSMYVRKSHRYVCAPKQPHIIVNITNQLQKFCEKNERNFQYNRPKKQQDKSKITSKHSLKNKDSTKQNNYIDRQSRSRNHKNSKYKKFDKVLIFDLDQTLIHSIDPKLKQFQNINKFLFQNQGYKYKEQFTVKITSQNKDKKLLISSESKDNKHGKTLKDKNIQLQQCEFNSQQELFDDKIKKFNYKNCPNTYKTNSISNCSSILVNLRPHVRQVLARLSQYFIIGLFTAAQQNYADSILQLLDPHESIFSFRLYQQHCTSLHASCPERFKDLRILNQNFQLQKLLLIDNSPISYFFQPENAIPIVPFTDRANDDQLVKLEQFLYEKVLPCQNVTDVTKIFGTGLYGQFGTIREVVQTVFKNNQ